MNPGIFGSLQNFKEDKTKPVKDEYEYVSDDGELKIDEFPIRRKKNTAKRDLSCKMASSFILQFGLDTAGPAGMWGSPFSG